MCHLTAFAWSWCPVHHAVQVEMRMGGAVRRRYRAKGLTEKGPRDLVFFNEQEQKDMTVLEYFERQYSIQCAYLPQPDTCLLRRALRAGCLA